MNARSSQRRVSQERMSLMILRQQSVRLFGGMGSGKGREGKERFGAYESMMRRTRHATAHRLSLALCFLLKRAYARRSDPVVRGAPFFEVPAWRCDGLRRCMPRATGFQQADAPFGSRSIDRLSTSLWSFHPHLAHVFTEMHCCCFVPAHGGLVY